MFLPHHKENDFYLIEDTFYHLYHLGLFFLFFFDLYHCYHYSYHPLFELNFDSYC